VSRLEHELSQLGGEVSGAFEELGVAASLLDRDGVIKSQSRASLEIGDVVGSRFTRVVAPTTVPRPRRC
jgi:hypothetical protein